MDNTKISDEAKGGGVSHDAGTGGSAMKTKQEKSPRIGRMRPIGDFFITSGTIAVCDSYASGDGVKWVRDALNSEWLGSVKVSDERDFGKRVAWLLVEAKEGRPSTPWKRQTFMVPVGGGKLCICDADILAAKSKDDRWRARCFEITSSRCLAGAFNGGVVSSSGYGDGCFECYVRRDKNGKAVAVMVDFGLEGGRKIMEGLCRGEEGDIKVREITDSEKTNDTGDMAAHNRNIQPQCLTSDVEDYIRISTTEQVVGYGSDGSPITEPVTIDTIMWDEIIDTALDEPSQYSIPVLRFLTDALHALRMVTTTMTPAQREVFGERWRDALEGAGVLERIAIMADAIDLALTPSTDRLW